MEERVNDIEDKLMAKRETKEKRDKQLKDHEDRLREISDSLRKKNLRLFGVLEDVKRDRGPEYVFEQIIAENFPFLFIFIFLFLKTFLIWEGKQAFRSKK